MDLVILHHHFRPGGVRRVIELAAPQLVRKLHPRPNRVVLASGERPNSDWLDGLIASVHPTPVLSRVEPTLGYLAEQHATPQRLASAIRKFLEQLLDQAQSQSRLVWAHNLGLGRNILLAVQLQRVCAARGVPVIFHHHDWWFDNRWARWPEMRRAGIRSVGAVARVIFPISPGLRHATINHADAKVLHKHLGPRTSWLPNPAGFRTRISTTALRRAREWLAEILDDRCPVWLMPCRLLRRKNIAEALLLTRWLRPEAWLVTTGGVTSPDEQSYCLRLLTSATENGWRLRLGVLEGLPSPKGIGRRKAPAGLPSVQDLLAASEAILLTSLQEGFGLAYLEAAATGRPLIARKLANIMPDLGRFGFRFPQCYAQLLVHPSLFDWEGEVSRQRRLFSEWQSQIPQTYRRLTGQPWVLRAGAQPSATPFNRLSLTAQLEVLRAPLVTSWERCLPLNPFLIEWRRLAQRASLRPTRWPRQAGRWLSGSAYARRFQRMLGAIPPDSEGRPPDPEAATAVQEELMRQKLTSENLYALSWNPET